MELSQLAGLYNGRIVIVNSGFRIIKDTYGLDENKLIISEELLKCFQGSRTMRYDEASEFIEMTIPLENDEDQVEGVLVISTPTNDIQESRSALSHKVLLLQIGMAALVFLAALYTSKLLIRPFGKVTQSLDEMTGGFLEEDISIPDYTETQLLSEAYNRMLKRLRVLEDSRQEFVSNVSHELKTPITSMKVLADSLISQDDVPVELYKEFMTDIGEEIDRENKIINDLLSLVKLDKKAAKAALQKHYGGKRLLPKIFKDQNHIDEIKGMYVPFWLFDADADATIRYKATRVRTWSDSRYNYTETSFFAVSRGGTVGFERVPVDGSSKMPDDLMESIEPFQFSDAVDFKTAYLAGYLADKYDVDADQSIERANERIKRSTEEAFTSTVQGYTSVVPETSSVKLRGGKARYALYPVWLLNTTWNGQKYTFAMNGQTGKLVGDLPVDKNAARRWTIGLTALCSAATYGIAWLLHFAGIL